LQSKGIGDREGETRFLRSQASGEDLQEGRGSRSSALWVCHVHNHLKYLLMDKNQKASSLIDWDIPLKSLNDEQAQID